MRKAHRAAVGAAIGVASLAALGAPLTAHPDGSDRASKAARAEIRADAREAREARRAERQAARNGVLAAALLGKNEISPTTGRRRAGDLDGRGGASVVIAGTQLCYAVAVKGIGTPNGLHVHQAPNNRNGDIVVPLTAPTSGDPGAASGCVPVTAELAAAIQRRPRAFYVNIHTQDFPAGALRGQLHGLAHGS
jgi:CHRD domain